MLDIPSISTIVASIGVLVGVALAYLEVRTLVRQRQTDLVMGLYSTFDSKEFMGAWKQTMTSEPPNFIVIQPRNKGDSIAIAQTIGWGKGGNKLVKLTEEKRNEVLRRIRINLATLWVTTFYSLPPQKMCLIEYHSIDAYIMMGFQRTAFSRHSILFMEVVFSFPKLSSRLWASYQPRRATLAMLSERS